MVNNLYKLTLVGAAGGPLVLAAACTATTSLGISASEELALSPAENAAQASSTASGPPRVFLPPEPTTFRPREGRQFIGSVSPFVGDIDGDGLDDFMLSGADITADDLFPDMAAYLFYGRAGFPPQLAAGEADATFATAWQVHYALGDINGDDLADFAVGHADSFEIVFGTAERFSGSYPALSSGGLVWHYMPPSSKGLTRIREMSAVGDVNGDGFDDFVMQVDFEDKLPVQYLIEGRRDGWPSGEWDPSWAAMTLPAHSAGWGDLNGDGYNDLLLWGDDGTAQLHYGGPDRADGSLAIAEESARISFSVPLLGQVFFAGDLDGDGVDDLCGNSLEDGEVEVTYGTRERLEGDVTLSPDLQVGARYVGLLGPGDVNADGVPDLMFSATLASGSGEPTEADVTKLYLWLGTGERLTGRHELQNDDLVALPDDKTGPQHLVGDVDGDGGDDLLIIELGRALLFAGGSEALF